MPICLDAAMERKLSIDFHRIHNGFALGYCKFKSHRDIDFITGNKDRVKFHVKNRIPLIIHKFKVIKRDEELF